MGLSEYKIELDTTVTVAGQRSYTLKHQAYILHIPEKVALLSKKQTATGVTREGVIRHAVELAGAGCFLNKTVT